MAPRQDDLLALLRSRLQMLDGVVARCEHRRATLELSDDERTRVARAIDGIEAALLTSSGRSLTLS